MEASRRLSCVPASHHIPWTIEADSSPRSRYSLLTSVISNSPRSDGLISLIRLNTL